MWAYPGSTCPDRPSLEELDMTEVETQICKVLDSAVVLPLGAGPDPLRRGIASVRVSTTGLVFVAFTILSLHCAHNIVQSLGDSHGNMWGVDLSVDALGPATSNVPYGATRWHEEREREREIGAPLVRQRGNGGWGPLLNPRPLVRGRWIRG
jgi:hypothetical protein